MSHTIKIQTKFKSENFSAFKRALEHFDWSVKENSRARYYSGDSAGSIVYPYVAVNPKSNGYDLGLKIEDGELAVYGDFYGGSVAANTWTPNEPSTAAVR